MSLGKRLLAAATNDLGDLGSLETSVVELCQKRQIIVQS
jgi:hypothetical protein